LNSGSESDDDGVNKAKFPTFKMPDKMKDYKWEVGTYFVSKLVFMEAMRTYAVHSGRAIKFRKNDKVRVRVGCKEGCPWEALCGKIPGEETWQLKKVYLGDHECDTDFNVNLMNSRWLGSKLHTRVRENRDLKISTIMERAQQKWNIQMCRSKAYRAKKFAVEFVEGSFRDQYTRLHDLRSNPHSSVKITSTPYEGTEADLENPNAVVCPRFQRMYVCFKGCMDSFFKCRKIIGLDGCFLNGPYGGMLLVAIGMDPNDQILPIAFAVVEGEIKEFWKWFLELLIDDLGGTGICRTYTIISDQQKVLFISPHKIFIFVYFFKNICFWL